MIENTTLLSNTQGYKKFNCFEISKELETILSEDYRDYNIKNLNNKELVNELYKKNFEDKYNRNEHKDIFKLYIDNKKFKEKAQFIYSIIDYNKYSEFVIKKGEIENPNELTIKYSILDSEGVKVQIYFINIRDISFVF